MNRDSAWALAGSVCSADPSEFEVRRERRIPRLWRGDAPCPVDLSLSHHGELVGFACDTKESLDGAV